jgi:hypothetical protein
MLVLVLVLVLLSLVAPAAPLLCRVLAATQPLSTHSMVASQARSLSQYRWPV